ncbi:MICAL C-terminal-like protein [Folsomia candida]|uniref:MICAL C-terminal-like protein n=1 Tax=Folsomia candida TaxID=158441 RepID=A0A226E630_FOLCA|nr:MICAL C-terminal-like protein [Folsomia candida]
MIILIDRVSIDILLFSKILSEMDERGTTPERVEFENSVDFASEEELLNEMDEDEWTDRNFGLSNADNTSDEASDLSDDEEVTPEGNNDAPNIALADAEKEGAVPVKPTETESSDSDTEVASEDDNGEVGDESDNEEEEEEDDDEYDEDEEDEEEECGGSTTEIETDSEFAEDPPNSVPGSIPTIVVDAPEQLVTKLVDTGLINHAKHVHPKEPKPSEHREKGSHHTQKFRDLYYDNNVELVKKGGPERQLPVVTGVPKKWEPNPERLASKVSLELKKKYLQGSSIPPVGTNPKKADPQQQNQFRSVLDMISEQQKLLQPASKPSATMQAFLDGADKLKNKTTAAGIVPIPLNRNLVSGQSVNLNQSEAVEKLASAADVNLVATLQQNNGNTVIQPISPNEPTTGDTEKTLKDTTNLIISSLHSGNSQDCKNDLEKQDLIPESIVSKCDANSVMTTSSEVSNNKLMAEEISGIMTSDTPSFSTSETGSNKTVIDANDYLISRNVPDPGNEHEEVGSGSDTEVGSEPYSDLDDLDEDDLPHRVVHEPPRVEIEDEFGVTKPMDPPPIGTKDHLDKSPTGHSSSDSSLNSGIFLETEMSDYVKDESVAAERAASAKKRLTGRRSLTKKCKQDIHQQRQTVGKLEDSPRTKTNFELEGLDFVDIDGGSSPDDFRDINEIGFGIRDINPPPVGAMKIQQNTISAPPLDTFAPTCHPKSQSPPITSPSEDDERSSTSTRDPQDHSTSDAELSDSLNNCLKNRNNISEVKFYNDIFSSKHMPTTTDKLPSLERVVPFSGARDSLDYRKARGVSTNLRNKDLYSTYSTPSTKPLGSEPEVIVAFSSVQFDEDSGVPSLEGGQDLSSLPGSTDDSNRSSGSPSTTRKLHEIRQERVKQNDLIRSMVLGRIKRSPDKTIRKNSKGSSSGTSLNLEKSGDEEADSRISSDTSQYHDDNTTSEDCDNNESTSRGTAKPNLHHHHNNSSTDISSGHDIPHKPMAESNSNSNSDDSSGSQSAKALLTTQAVHSAYEPVFTSSPRFRNRPKFDVVTNSQQQQPQAKTEPPTPTHAIPADMPYPSINSSKNNETSYTTQNPLFCRSMPNLINLLPKNNHTAVHHDDESNGILPNTTQNKSSSAAMYQTSAPRYEHPSNLVGGAGGGQSSKINPFLVSSYGPGEEQIQSSNDPGDDFLSLHLKLRSKDQLGSQRTAEKSRSVYSDSSKDYSDSGYGHTGSHPSSVMTMRFQHTQLPDQDFSLVPQGWGRNEIRPRSNTLTDFDGKTHSPVTLPNFNASKSHVHPNSRHSIDNSDASSKSSSNKAKAFSSDTLVDASPLSESSRRTSVPDISGSGRSNDVVMRMNKGRKGKDRDRRRSLIQTVSDFFTSRTTQNNTSTNDKSPPNTSLTTSTSSSSIMSPTKDKFSLFKLTPKLLQNKDKKNSSKSKESVVVSPLALSGQSAEGRSKTDFTTYLSQPDLQIQRLSSSPTNNIYKAEKQQDDEKDVDECAGNLSNLSIMAPGSSRRANLSSAKETDRSKRAMTRAREIEEIQLQLESIETDQRSLEAAGVIMEKKLRGEEVDENGRSDDEIMDEWFALVRDKTKLARFEKELLVRAQELELEVRREQLEEQLEVSLSIPDKSPNDTQRENDIMYELRRLKDQHVRLLDTIHSDMERYTSEDVTTLNPAFSISPGNSRLESDV